MPRPRNLDRDEERRLGRILVRARARRICWQRLMVRYELGRTKLNGVWRLARQGAEGI